MTQLFFSFVAKKVMKKTILFAVLFVFKTHSQIAHSLKTQKANHQTKTNKTLLQKKYHELSNKKYLFQSTKSTVYQNENLTAIQFPVGGIGTGCIQYDGNAIPKYWQIFNNMTHDFIPNSFFAIRTQNQKDTQVRVLQTQDISPFKGMKSLKMTSQFPFINYTFQDELPVKIKMKVHNPFIPTDLKNSQIPAVFYTFTLENKTNLPIQLNLLASQQNAVGFSQIKKIEEGNSFKARFQKNKQRKPIQNNTSLLYGNNTNQILTHRKTHILKMTNDRKGTHEHFGQMALLVFPNLQIDEIKSTKHWDNISKLKEQFHQNAKLIQPKIKNKSPKNQTYTGAFNIKINLKPKQKTQIKIALLWYFPNGKNGGHLKRWDGWGNGKWQGLGNYYANYWKNIDHLTDYIITNQKKLEQQTQTFTKAFYQTNLPKWLVERLANQLSILKSKTIFHSKNNFVGLWEGVGACDGSCSGNCNHVWHYAQAHARLFPKLARKIREQSFQHMRKNGAIPYRLPNSTLIAFDGQCGEILATYRESLLANRKSWLKEHYPKVKKAMNFLIETHDPDQDGWLSDAKKHTTYDASISGNPSFLASLYLASLRACEQMASKMKDFSYQIKCKTIADQSAKMQNQKLWNGEYFFQIPAKEKGTDYETGCHSDQILGQWWANQLNLGALYKPKKLEKATKSMLKYNFKSTLINHDQGHRTFALPQEAGVVVTTWPKENRTKYASGYSGEVWTTFEYTLGSLLMKYGTMQDALTVLRSGFDRYNGVLKTKYQGDWGNFGFSGNPFGDDECGQFYSRALSMWSVLLSSQGFHFDSWANEIVFHPKWKPENHQSFFSTSQGWGVFSQMINEKQTDILKLKYGKLTLQTVTLNTEKQVKKVKIYRNEKEIKGTFSQKDKQIKIKFSKLSLKENDTLKILLH